MIQDLEVDMTLAMEDDTIQDPEVDMTRAVRATVLAIAVFSENLKLLPAADHFPLRRNHLLEHRGHHLMDHRCHPLMDHRRHHLLELRLHHLLDRRCHPLMEIHHKFADQ